MRNYEFLRQRRKNVKENDWRLAEIFKFQLLSLLFRVFVNFT